MPSSQTDSSLTEPVLPFLKWPGGKRWVADAIAKRVRSHLRGTYFEPFLGGGAVFFALRPASAILSDINGDLVNTYRQVAKKPREVLAALRKFSVDSETYYRIRASTPASALGRAVRFLYLNRTSFGGIYRLNRLGEFNVPFGGRSPSPLWDRLLIKRAATCLDYSHLRIGDFEEIAFSRASRGDVVYCDPAYTVAHENNGFVRYNEKNFSWSDQQRLAKLAERAKRKGVFVLVTNASHRRIRELYRGARRISFRRNSLVSRRLSGRRTIKEDLFIFEP